MEPRYLSDWSGTRYGTPAELMRPSDLNELTNWIEDCHRGAFPIAVQGGRTGVSGGAAPGDGERILSMEDMRQVVEFDQQSGIVVVEAGMVLAELQELVEVEGWSFPLDLGSRGSCQVGGNAATNAGGSRVIKYGNMRNLVLGLEAVLADGSVLGPPNKLVKNNAGYSLSNLLIGSEGTLGVITKLALQLVPIPAVRRNALLALAPAASLSEVLKRCRIAFGVALSAFEVMWNDYLEAAQAVKSNARTLPDTFQGRRAVLVELEGDNENRLTEQLEVTLSELVENGLLEDVVLASTVKDASDLWAIRESVGEIQAGIRPYVGFYLGMAAADYDSFIQKAKHALDKTGLSIKSYFFGHAGDGNLHALIGPASTDEEQRMIEQSLYGLLPKFTTTVTAEHGVGRKKKALLECARTRADINAMIMIKKALDPKNILNPGRIIDP